MTDYRFEFVVENVTEEQAQRLMEYIVNAVELLTEDANIGGGYCDARQPDPVAEALASVVNDAIRRYDAQFEEAEDLLASLGYAYRDRQFVREATDG